MELARIQLSDISDYIDPYAIKNFIVSDKALTAPVVSPDHPFVLDGVAFVICVRGSGRIRVNFKDYDIEKNTIITILPHFVTEFLSKSDDLVMEFLIFSVDFLTDMPQSPDFDISRTVLQSSCIKATDEETEKLLEFHAFVVKQYQRKDHPYREEMAKSLLFSLLAEIGGIYFNQVIRSGGKMDDTISTSHQDELIFRFFKLLLLHHKQEKTLEFYADKMCLTSKYLSTVVKERTGRTAFSWINEALVSSAKYMLKTTNMTIVQISEELNFPNPSFFGRFFKKHAGVTPVQYREG